MKGTTALLLALLAPALLAGCAGHQASRTPLTPEEIMALPDARMRSIVLSQVELSNATIQEVVRYLTTRSKEADPDKQGVTIQFRQYRVQDIAWRVNISLPQATVLQVLEEACLQTRCHYLIGKDIVTVMPEDSFKRATPLPPAGWR